MSGGAEEEAGFGLCAKGVQGEVQTRRGGGCRRAGVCVGGRRGREVVHGGAGAADDAHVVRGFVGWRRGCSFGFFFFFFWVCGPVGVVVGDEELD